MLKQIAPVSFVQRFEIHQMIIEGLKNTYKREDVLKAFEDLMQIHEDGKMDDSIKENILFEKGKYLEGIKDYRNAISAY